MPSIRSCLLGSLTLTFLISCASTPEETPLKAESVVRETWSVATAEDEEGNFYFCRRKFKGDQITGFISKLNRRGREVERMFIQGTVEVSEGGFLVDYQFHPPLYGDKPIRRFYKVISVSDERVVISEKDNVLVWVRDLGEEIIPVGAAVQAPPMKVPPPFVF